MNHMVAARHTPSTRRWLDGVHSTHWLTCAQVPGWDGDLVDLTQTAAVGIVAGVCSRAVIGVATGVLKSCAVGGIVLYASQYSGFFKLDTAKIKRSARALVGKVDLLGALEKLGFPDDPAGIKAHAFDLAEDQWEANEHRALGGVVGFGASFMV